jgi:hypothetical protein
MTLSRKLKAVVTRNVKKDNKVNKKEQKDDKNTLNINKKRKDKNLVDDCLLEWNKKLNCE